jgi:uncharacterized RDD family membrane protein YckC
MAKQLAVDITVPLRPAGFVSRMVAFMIDQILLIMVLLVLTASATILSESFRLNDLIGDQDRTVLINAFLAGAGSLILNLLYYVGFWRLAGQTPGKALLGLLVIRTDGRRISLWQAVVRWIGYWISGILFMGYLWILVDNRRQGFHDKLAGTLVVYYGLDPRVTGLPGQVRAGWQAAQQVPTREKKE